MVDDTTPDSNGTEEEVVETNNRRTFLTGLGAAAVGSALAGCSNQQGDNQQNSSNDGGSSGGSGSVVELTLDIPEYGNVPDLMRDLANQWQEDLGVQTKLKTTSWGTYLGKIYIDQNYKHVAWTAFGGSPERMDPTFYLSLHTEDQPMNVSNIQDQKYEDLYEQLTSTYESSERNKIIKEMQTIWAQEHVSQVLYYWGKKVVPYNKELWEFQPTKFQNIVTAATKSIITAKPKTDQTTLIMGGQEAHQRPNAVAPTANAMDWLFRSVYDTPRRLNFDGTFENWAIQNYNVVDKQTIDLKLRDGMKWHDGEDVTAEDLKFSLEFLSEYSFGKIDSHVEPVESVDVETDLDVRVHLKKPWATFTTSTLVYMWILPQHIWGDVPDKIDQPVNWDQKVGDDPPGQWAASGPLQVRSVSPDRIELEAFDDHFSGYPEYDELIYQRVGSEEALRAGLVNGKYHMPIQVPSVPLSQKVNEQAESVELSVTRTLNTDEYAFNVKNKPLDDKAIRRALRKTTNAQKLLQVYERGMGQHSDTTPIHPDLQFGRDDLPLLGPVKKDSEKDLYDPEGARQILEEAGYTWDNQDRLRYPQ